MDDTKSKTMSVHRMNEILKNYHHERHFLQIVHMSNKGMSKRPFVYMKNHKAACSTVLATTLRHQMEFLNLPVGPIGTDIIHKPPKILMRNGKRNLNVDDAVAALKNPRYFKFTVVREPVLRVLSAFSDKISEQTKQRAAFFKHIGKNVEDELSLEDFIDIVTQDSVARDLDRHWRSQCKEISYGLIKYDFIGTVDAIGTALRDIMGEAFGQRDFHVEDTRKTIGHKTKSASLRGGLKKKDLSKLELAYSEDFEMYEVVASATA